MFPGWWVLLAWWNLMIISNESMNFKDPKESDDPNYSMIPAAAIRWSPGIRWSPDIRWSIRSMDFVNRKVFGDTSITDGLVSPWRLKVSTALNQDPSNAVSLIVMHQHQASLTPRIFVMLQTNSKKQLITFKICLALSTFSPPLCWQSL